MLTVPTALLLEDNDDDAFLLTRLLERVPMVVERVRTLREAVFALLAQSKPYALVLTDLNLPDSQGLSTVRSLVKYHKTVLVLTGDPGYDELDAIREGADDLIYKSDTFANMRRAVSIALAREERRRGGLPS